MNNEISELPHQQEPVKIGQEVLDLEAILQKGGYEKIEIAPNSGEFIEIKVSPHK